MINTYDFRAERPEMFSHLAVKNLPGFENATHFSRMFKEKFELSPLRYRTQIHSLSLIQ